MQALNTMTCRDAALTYARRGWHVFPVRGKSGQYLDSWIEECSNNPDVITAWWETWPDANVAIACGKSKIVVLDTDAEEADTFLDTLGIPATLKQKTGNKGHHFIFNAPHVPVGNRANIGKIHLDVRGDGGYIVAPPSIHPETGNTYQWTNDDDVANVPDHIVKLIEKSVKVVEKIEQRDYQGYEDRYAAVTKHRVLDKLQNAQEGERNDTLNKTTFALACLWRAGRIEETVFDTVQSIALDIGLDEREVTRTMDSAMGSAEPNYYGMSFNYTDAGNAEYFNLLFHDQARYCHTRGKWLLWDGTRWDVDEIHDITKYGVELARQRFQDAGDINDLALRKVAVSHALKSEEADGIRDTLLISQSYLGTTVKTYDTAPMKAGTQNVTLDLKTGTSYTPRRDDYITKTYGTVYDPDATCPRWETFLTEVFNSDTELVQWIQRAVGYSLTGDTREQVFFLMHGGGSNGKSVFIETVSKLLGDYAANTSFDTFDADSRKDSTNALAALVGTRLVTIIETGQDKRLNEPRVKAATGQDRITCRFLYREFFSYRPEFKIWVAMNHKPIITGTDRGIWRRIRLIPFEASFEGREDKTLSTDLERELPGILNWALRGLDDWHNQGLGWCDAVKSASEAYRYESDKVSRWLDERCITSPRYDIPAKVAYEDYAEWCEDNNERPEAHKRFWLNLQEKGYEKKRSANGSYVYIGFKLTEFNNHSNDQEDNSDPNLHSYFSSSSNFPLQRVTEGSEGSEGKYGKGPHEKNMDKLWKKGSEGSDPSEGRQNHEFNKNEMKNNDLSHTGQEYKEIEANLNDISHCNHTFEKVEDCLIHTNGHDTDALKRPLSRDDRSCHTLTTLPPVSSKPEPLVKREGHSGNSQQWTPYHAISEDRVSVSVDEGELHDHIDYKASDYPAWTPDKELLAYERVGRVSLDIETTGLDPKRNRVIAIGVRLHGGDGHHIFMYEDERRTLQEALHLIEALQPGILIGHNLFNFDLPLIMERAYQYGLKTPWIVNQYQKRITSASMNGSTIEYTPISYKRMRGKRSPAIIDTMHQAAIYDKITSSLNGYGLKDVAIQLGLREERRLDLGPNEINDYWERGEWGPIKEYLQYDLEDTEMLGDFFIPVVYYQQRVVPMHLEPLAVASPAKKWQMVIEKLYRGNKGHREPIADDKKTYEGGYVSCNPGLYTHAAKLDVSSMYPSIQLRYGLATRKDEDRRVLGVLDWLRTERFRLKKLAKTVDDPALRNRYDQEQQALKIMINGGYGFAGTGGYSYNDMGTAALITAYGRVLIRHMIDEVQNAGGQVVEVDTDGVIFAAENAHEVFETVQGSLPDGIGIDLDWQDCVVYAPKAKNYMIIKPDGMVKVNGIYRKRNRSKLQREFPVEFIKRYVDDPDRAERYYQQLRSDIENGAYLVEDLAVTQKISTSDKTLSGAGLGKAGDKVTYVWVEEKRFHKKTGKPITSGKKPVSIGDGDYYSELYITDLDKMYHDIMNVISPTK